jgi:pre-mRNA-splicing factor SPF27
MANEILVDALPYFDVGFDEPGVREMALAMVDEECRRYKPSKNYLESLPPLNTAAFETDLMKNEFQRLESGVRMETMNTKRYELPAPPTGKLGEIQAWQEAVDNSFAQLEHQSIRYLNLELLQKYGCEAWKIALEVLVGLSARAQKDLSELKKEIQEINWRRKSKQIDTGEKLNRLNQQWAQLVSCNFEIELAIETILQQINNLSQVKDEAVEEKSPEPEPVKNEEVETNGHKEQNGNGSQDTVENEQEDNQEDVEMT